MSSKALELQCSLLQWWEKKTTSHKFWAVTPWHLGSAAHASTAFFHLLPIAVDGEGEQVALIPNLGVTVAGEG